MSVVVVGLNHRTVPLDLLERMAVPAAHLPKVLHALHEHPDLREVVVLSTCMRTEVYADVERYHPALAAIREVLATRSGLPPEDFADHLYAYFEEPAAAHLFKVAAGLDSAVLGEGEVLGQVGDAWAVARAEGADGPVLARLFRHAVEVGKRARTETSIARGTTSVSQAAVAMAAERLGTLDGRRILVLGAGEMGEGVAVALAGAYPGATLLVANRTRSTAEALAARVGGEAVSLDDVTSVVADVDLVVSSTGSPDPILLAEELAPVVESRPGRPLLLVDIAVPRDVERAVAALPGVTVLDMDDLKAFAAAGVAARRGEVAAVQAIVEDEVERWVGVAAAAEVGPIVASLRDRAEAVRQAELERFAAKLEGLGPREREAVEALTRGVLNKLLHEPTVRLKDAAGSPRGDRLADALRQLFDLDG